MKKDRKEVEYKEKAGTAWSHSYLNQKPWHPLSYPNQRRKWIAEQTHSQRAERNAEVAREFAQEQEFFRQTAQMSKKEKEKMEAMQAVSFMYMRPPGYNAEAARAAEIADERKKLGLTASTANANAVALSHDGGTDASVQDKRKPRAKDVFGRTLPTEEEFPALKDAPRHDTGAPARVKPFAIEIRNVKCARCGAFGHQSGDRECPLKDALMPNEEARLIREDPLNVILAQTTSDEPLKWELKRQSGLLSPARGGFKPDDPNQQIIPDDDIYDEYGGFLPAGADEGGLSIPNLLASLSREQRKELTDANAERKLKRRKHKKQKSKRTHAKRRKYSSSSEDQGRYRNADSERLVSSDDEKISRGPRCRNKSESSDDAQNRYFRRNEEEPENRDERRTHRPTGKRKLESSDNDQEKYEHGNDRQHDGGRSSNPKSTRNLQRSNDSWENYSDKDVGISYRRDHEHVTQNLKGKEKFKGSHHGQRRRTLKSNEESDSGGGEHRAHHPIVKHKLEDGYGRYFHRNDGKSARKDVKYRSQNCMGNQTSDDSDGHGRLSRSNYGKPERKDDGGMGHKIPNHRVEQTSEGCKDGPEKNLEYRARNCIGKQSSEGIEDSPGRYTHRNDVKPDMIDAENKTHSSCMMKSKDIEDGQEIYNSSNDGKPDRRHDPARTHGQRGTIKSVIHCDQRSWVRSSDSGSSSKESPQLRAKEQIVISDDVQLEKRSIGKKGFYSSEDDREGRRPTRNRGINKSVMAEEIRQCKDKRGSSDYEQWRRAQRVDYRTEKKRRKEPRNNH